MLKQMVFSLSFLFFINLGFSQTQITWFVLADVNFENKYSEEEGGYQMFPRFGNLVKQFEGEEVYLKGYILAIDPEIDYYLLSMNPNASCFFCGAAGPETVVELKFKDTSKRFEMDEVVTIKGRLKLNSSNLYQCSYIFMEAEEYEP